MIPIYKQYNCTVWCTTLSNNWFLALSQTRFDNPEVSVICLIIMSSALLIIFQTDEHGKSGEKPTVEFHTLTNTKCVGSLLVVHLIVLIYCNSYGTEWWSKKDNWPQQVYARQILLIMLCIMWLDFVKTILVLAICHMYIPLVVTVLKLFHLELGSLDHG